jgi:hypothetical protein
LEAVGIKVQIRQVDATFVSKKSTAFPQGFEPVLTALRLDEV